MLLTLYIENFALIEKLSLNFQKGFNVLTGETGAGKSIIIDAINMILGERASTDLIKTGQERAFVEAVFSQKDNPRLIKVLNKLGLTIEEDSLIISRELSPGKSIARLNNRTISQNALREISSYLFDIHGQHQHQSLLQVEEHLNILDSFGGKEILNLRKQVNEEYNYLQKFVNELKQLKASATVREKEKEYLKFQIEEIAATNLKAGEFTELQKEQKLLKNAEKLAQRSKQVVVSLNILSDHLHTAQVNLNEMANLDDSLKEKSNNLDNTSFTIEDTIAHLRNYQKQ
ncbi:MAG: AAA family ATPase, partial [Candidatus Margulisbacteria bacterium]|nr:AAA family ATPase [Candidatus Margulisiibacteriota bacterium]